MSQTFPEYEEYDAIGLSQLVKDKQVSPKELVETAIQRIEKLNPEIQAVNTPLFDFAVKM